MTNLSNRMYNLILALLASVVIVGFVTVAQWQSYRYPVDQSLKQALESAAISSQLESGTVKADALSNMGQPINPKESKGLFVFATNEAGEVKGSTLKIDGQSPVPSVSTLEKAKDNQKAVSWNVDGHPIALVVEHYGGENPGYVAVGQSLQEVREQQNKLLIQAGIALLVLAVISVLATKGGSSGFGTSNKTKKDETKADSKSNSKK